MTKNKAFEGKNYHLHGYKHTATYRAWENIKRRCNGAGVLNKKYYKDKNISYCLEWKLFTNFLKDMGEKPEGYFMDRIDNNKGYYKDNCRWVDKSHSGANKIFPTKKNGLPRGVRKQGNKYTARISHIKCMHIGCYNTIEEAEKAYLFEYKKIYGELPPERRSK